MLDLPVARRGIVFSGPDPRLSFAERLASAEAICADPVWVKQGVRKLESVGKVRTLASECTVEIRTAEGLIYHEAHVANLTDAELDKLTVVVRFPRISLRTDGSVTELTWSLWFCGDGRLAKAWSRGMLASRDGQPAVGLDTEGTEQALKELLGACALLTPVLGESYQANLPDHREGGDEIFVMEIRAVNGGNSSLIKLFDNLAQGRPDDFLRDQWSKDALSSFLHLLPCGGDPDEGPEAPLWHLHETERYSAIYHSHVRGTRADLWAFALSGASEASDELPALDSSRQVGQTLTADY